MNICTNSGRMYTLSYTHSSFHHDYHAQHFVCVFDYFVCIFFISLPNDGKDQKGKNNLYPLLWAKLCWDKHPQIPETAPMSSLSWATRPSWVWPALHVKIATGCQPPDHLPLTDHQGAHCKEKRGYWLIALDATYDFFFTLSN